MNDDIPDTKEALQRALLSLRAAFASGTVGAGLFPCLQEAEVLAFERKHSVRLPPEYRMFLLLVGNGGEELFKLGEMDDGFDFKPWQENDDFVGTLAEPFQYAAAWNDLAGYPEYDPEKEDDEAWLEEYDRELDLFEQRYFLPLNGAVPVAHLGCAIRLWLVVTGPEHGNVWHDDRANRQGLRPLPAPDGGRLSFLEWCEGWRNG